MIKDILRRLVEGERLSTDEAAAAMASVMDGEATAAQIAGMLTALRMRGETVDEITGFARVMRERAVRVMTARTPLIDTCGTGGDSVKTFNISTSAAFVVAGAGVGVAKHGNRAVTSKCGSADVLEALDVRLDLTPEAVGRCIDAAGIGFLFARSHHPAMKHAAPVRAELGVRTIFNVLGPLTNPAGATRQLIGVFDPALCEPLARVLGNLGAEHVMVVHGGPGLDEVATFGETTVAEYENGDVRTYALRADDFGLPGADPNDLAAGCDAAENARHLTDVLEGTPGPRRDVVLANAAAALRVAGVVSTLRDGAALAAETIDSGAARERLTHLIQCTREAAEKV